MSGAGPLNMDPHPAVARNESMRKGETKRIRRNIALFGG